MRRLAVGLVGLVALGFLAGCGATGPSPSDDKALRDKLSQPPSLAGMAAHHPKGAKQPPAGAPGAGTAGTTGAPVSGG